VITIDAERERVAARVAAHFERHLGAAADRSSA
jgi:hypothetical protein